MTPGTEKVREWAGMVRENWLHFRRLPIRVSTFAACLAYGAYLRGMVERADNNYSVCDDAITVWQETLAK